MDASILRFAVGVLAAFVVAVSAAFALYWQFLGKGHRSAVLQKTHNRQ
jgi:hypothetical protein